MGTFSLLFGILFVLAGIWWFIWSLLTPSSDEYAWVTVLIIFGILFGLGYHLISKYYEEKLYKGKKDHSCSKS